MTLLEAVILGLIQGLTEFLPVSSSGHLLFAHHFLGVKEYGLGFDVALHIGTLLALLIFFYRDVSRLIISIFRPSCDTRIAWLLMLATIPAVIAGMLLQNLAESSFRSPYLASIALIVMAFIMLAAEKVSSKMEPGTDIHAVTRWQAIGIGLAQAVALIPGISRSGSTITSGLFLGLTRVAATRFSFLLSIPITVGAIAKVLADPATHSQISQQTDLFAVGIVTAFLSGLAAIRFLLKYLAKHSLGVFAYYRIALGMSILVLLAVA